MAFDIYFMYWVDKNALLYCTDTKNECTNVGGYGIYKGCSSVVAVKY
jgi:hypothetical protein